MPDTIDEDLKKFGNIKEIPVFKDKDGKPFPLVINKDEL